MGQQALVEEANSASGIVDPVGAPSALREDDLLATVPGLAWRVLHTRPRQEKAVSEMLSSAGIRHFLPTYRRVRLYGHRRRETLQPLFPSYIFVHGSREDAFFAMSTKRIARIIDVSDQGLLVHELEQIRAAVTGRATLDPYPYLKVGKRVRVTAGPFKGVEGLVDLRARSDRLILKVDALGRAVSLEIDAGLLEPVD